MWTGVLLLSLVAAAPYAGQPAPTAAADCTRWQDCRDRVEAALAAESFDTALERAIVVLLSTPVSDTPARLQATGGTDYAYADARLEGLSAAQKQLLRTGPRNARVIQDALRRIALALGIPESRLPAAR